MKQTVDDTQDEKKLDQREVQTLTNSYLMVDPNKLNGVLPKLYNYTDYNNFSRPTEDIDMSTGGINPSATALPDPIIGKRIQLPDGDATVTALGWQASGEQDSGWIRTAANDYQYLVNGSSVTEWLASEFRVNYLTLGSVLFAGTSGKISQDNANFFWDDTNNRLGIGTTAPLRSLEVQHASLPQLVLSTDSSNGVIFQGSASGCVVTGYQTSGAGIPFFSVQGAINGTIEMSVYNTRTSGNSSAKFLVQVDPGSSGDPYYQLYNGATIWTSGLDNSDSDKWKLSKNATLGTNDYVIVDTSGNMFLHGPSPWADVKAYGAVGDDSTDDSTAIQAAITAVGNAGGGIVYFPTASDKYAFGTGLTIPTGVYLVGTGKNSSIIRYTGTGTAVSPDGTGNNTGGIRNMSIAVSGNNAVALDVSRWIRGSFTSVRFISTAGTGQVGTKANITNVAWTSFYNEFVDCTWDGLATGISVDASVAQRANRWRLVAPTFLSCGTSMNIANVQGMQIIGAHSEDHTTTALNLGANADRVQVIAMTDESASGQTFTVNAAANKCQLIGFSTYSSTLGLASWNAFGTGATVLTDSILGIGGQFGNFGTVTDATTQGDFAAGLTTGGKIVFDQSVPSYKWYSSNSRFDVYLDTPAANTPALNWQSASATKMTLYRPATTNDLALDSNAISNIMYWTNGGKVGVNQGTVSARLHVSESTLGNEVFRAESTATNDDPNLSVYQNRVATTDATVTTLHSFTLTASTTYRIEARVVARRTGGTSGTAEDGAGYIIVGTYKTVAGAATLVGAVSALYTAEDQAAWDATLDTSGTAVRVRVTGAANNNVTWHSTLIVSQVGT